MGRKTYGRDGKHRRVINTAGAELVFSDMVVTVS